MPRYGANAFCAAGNNEAALHSRRLLGPDAVRPRWAAAPNTRRSGRDSSAGCRAARFVTLLSATEAMRGFFYA